MKYKFEFIEYSLYENEWLENLLHERAKQGWIISEIGRSYAIYKKGKPQDIYFTVDYFDKKYLVSGLDSDKVLEYADFLTMYSCERICGYGFRQIIKIPYKEFQLYKNDEKENLKARCIKRDRNFYVTIWLILLIAFIIGTITHGFVRNGSYLTLIRYIGYMSFWTIYTMPYLIENKKQVNFNVRKYMLIAVVILVILTIGYLIYIQGIWMEVLILMASVLVISASLDFLQKRNWISKSTFRLLVIVFAICFAIATIFIVYPKDMETNNYAINKISQIN